MKHDIHFSPSPKYEGICGKYEGILGKYEETRGKYKEIKVMSKIQSSCGSLATLDPCSRTYECFLACNKYVENMKEYEEMCRKYEEISGKMKEYPTI